MIIELDWAKEKSIWRYYVFMEMAIFPENTVKFEVKPEGTYIYVKYRCIYPWTKGLLFSRPGTKNLLFSRIFRKNRVVK